jgi:hypothetical protein
MNDKELLKQADEFLSIAGLQDYVSTKLVIKMKTRLEELTADKEPQSIVWEPKLGEKYYFLHSDGKVHGSHWHHRIKTELHLNLLKHHNVYKTRELAEKAAQYQKRYNMVAQAVLNLEPNQVVYWSDTSQLKYSVYFDHERGIWDSNKAWSGEQGYPVLIDEKNVQPLLDYLNAKEKENG